MQTWQKGCDTPLYYLYYYCTYTVLVQMSY